NSIDSSEVGFNYAGSASKGGAASNVVCTNCITLGVETSGSYVTSETDPTVLASVKDGITWLEIASRPPGLDDGDQVGITSETDPTVLASVKDGITWTEIASRPPGLDDGDQVGITSETDPTVPASVKDGISWGEVSGRPAFNGCAGANLALKTLDLNTGATTCETDDIGAGGITGSGTANYISKWTGGTSLGNSIIYDNGFVGIGTAGPGYKLDVVGDIRTSGTLRTNYVEASTAIGGTTVNAYSQL
ncbi:hypothetical protein KKA96_05035, partial [Patescibacteria group bacterium]|nr:hypothetical protein [Patescibacteria group bacterium]